MHNCAFLIDFLTKMYIWQCQIWGSIMRLYINLGVHLCLHKLFLDLNSFPKTLQGMDIPSRWLASMWSLILIACPSFPHTLQILALGFSFPFWIRFWHVSIIDFAFSSSSCKSPDTKFGIDILCHYRFLHDQVWRNGLPTGKFPLC